MPNIDMTVTVWTIVCLAGLILLAVSAIGGGVIVWQINVPLLRNGSRILTGILGCLLVALGLWGSMFVPATNETHDKKLTLMPKAQPSQPSLPLTPENNDVAKPVNKENLINRNEAGINDSYIVQAGSFDMTTTDKQQVRNASEKLRKCSGVNFKIVSYSEYKFLTPQKWIIAAGPYSKSDASDAKDKIASCGVKDALVRLIQAN